MDWFLYAEQLGRVKQNQIRMMQARGCAIAPAERALLGKDPSDVTRHFCALATAQKCSVPSVMNCVYSRVIHGVRERLHVVYIGLRMDDSGSIKHVPIDALRAAIGKVMDAEGGVFSNAMELSSKRRRFGALRDALSTHAGSIAVDVAARSASAFSVHAITSTSLSSLSSLSTTRAAAPMDAEDALVQAHETDEKDETDETRGDDSELPETVSAVLITPAPLTSDAAKEAARSREWLSVFEYTQLAFPLGEHEDVMPHDFVRGEAAEAALAALRANMQDMPVLMRDDAVALYFGARPGDISRVQKPMGVVHWMALR